MKRTNIVQEKRCLLIVPISFYSFADVLEAGLRSRGYHLDVLNEEYPSSFVGKIISKVSLPLLRFLTLRIIKRKIGESCNYDLVLIIKGRGIGKKAVQYLKSVSAYTIGYNFDSFAYNPSSIDWYKDVDDFATFDIDDSNDYGIRLVHLFSSANYTEPKHTRKYDLSIIQRLHSNRLEYAFLLERMLSKEFSLYIFLYESNCLTSILGLIKNPILYFKMLKYISFTPLSYEEAFGVMSDSEVTFDYAHPKQSGITIRCFEALSMGVKVLTNNNSVISCSIFSQDSVGILRGNENHEQMMTKLNKLLSAPQRIVSRDINDFLNELLVVTNRV